MKLSEFILEATKVLEKYGDREVVVDTEAMSYDSHFVEITRIGMQFHDSTYKEHPEFLTDYPYNIAIIDLDNRCKSIPNEYPGMTL